MQRLAPRETWAERDGHSHPKTEMLRDYYVDPSKLEAETRQAIEAHLDRCADCAYDLAFLKDLEQALPAAISERVPNRAAPRFLPQWLSRPVPVFSLAAALVGVFLVVYFQVNPRTEHGTEESGIQIHVLRPLTRGQAGAASITRTDQSQTIHVALPRPEGNPDAEYQIQIRDDRETTEFAVILDSDRSLPDRIIVGLNTAPLADGRYVVVLTERMATAPIDSSVRRFPFQLRTSP